MPALSIADSVAFLGQVGLVADQVGHDLEAPGDFIRQFQRKMYQLGQHPVQTDANGQGGFPRFDVQVAGLGGDGIEEQAIDQDADFNALLGRLRL